MGHRSVKDIPLEESEVLAKFSAKMSTLSDEFLWDFLVADAAAFMGVFLWVLGGIVAWSSRSSISSSSKSELAEPREMSDWFDPV